MQFIKRLCLMFGLFLFGSSSIHGAEATRTITNEAINETMKVIRENPEEQIRKKLPPIIKKYINVSRVVNILKRKGKFNSNEETALTQLVIARMLDVVNVSLKSYKDAQFTITEIKAGKKFDTVIGELTGNGKKIEATIKVINREAKIADIIIEKISWVKVVVDKIKDDMSKQGIASFKKDMMKEFGK